MILLLPEHFLKDPCDLSVAFLEANHRNCNEAGCHISHKREFILHVG